MRRGRRLAVIGIARNGSHAQVRHRDRIAPRRYRPAMPRFLWPIAALLVVPSCSDGPVDAPFGLDQRPSNPTCLAQNRPVLNTGVTLQPQWSTLTFSEPVLLLQAPGDNNQWFV